MYEERKPIFSMKKIIVTILIIVLLLFILMWFFPTKGYLTNNEKQTSVVKVFSENILLMKETALSYYTDERLPEKTDEKVKMTLSEMIDNHLITELVDSNNQICNLEKSYVEVTKKETEYLMKIKLSCADKSDYINTHMGSYTYCVSDICEKKNKLNSPESQNNVKEASEEVVKTADKKNNPNVNSQTSKCKYSKVVNTYTKYGSWSSWSKQKVNASNTVNVQTKVVNEKSGVNKKQYTTEIRVKAEKKIVNGQTIYICSNEFENAGRYAYEPVCIKKKIIYKEIPVYKDVVYYRYQSRKLVQKNIVKWDRCDSKLINQGYRKIS